MIIKPIITNHNNNNIHNAMNSNANSINTINMINSINSTQDGGRMLLIEILSARIAR